MGAKTKMNEKETNCAKKRGERKDDDKSRKIRRVLPSTFFTLPDLMAVFVYKASQNRSLVTPTKKQQPTNQYTRNQHERKNNIIALLLSDQLSPNFYVTFSVSPLYF